MSNRHSGNLGEYEYFWHCTPQTIYNAQSKYATSNAIVMTKIMPPTRHMRCVLFENWNVMSLIFLHIEPNSSEALQSIDL